MPLKHFARTYVLILSDSYDHKDEIDHTFLQKIRSHTKRDAMMIIVKLESRKGISYLISLEFVMSSRKNNITCVKGSGCP